MLVVMKSGGIIKEHRAQETASIHVLSGRVRVRLPDRSVDLASGRLLVLERGSTAHRRSGRRECASTHPWLASDTVTAGDVYGMDRERSREAGLSGRRRSGKKVAMGVTGAALALFVIGHVLGNLLVFRGRSELNRYSSLLHARLSSFSGRCARSCWRAFSYTSGRPGLSRGRHAPPDRSATRRRLPQAATWASRNAMRWGGVLIAVFVVVHVLHLTTGTIRPVPFTKTDVYSNVVGAFRVLWVAAFYLVAMTALGLHLFHGVWAAFRSTGVSRPTTKPLRRPLATVVALCVWAGFTAIPLGVLLGIVR